MKSYQELLEGYRRRCRDTVVDTLATGLTYMDNVAVETGILEEAGLVGELTETLCGVLPFAVIAVTEGTKVILRRKPARQGMTDGAFRMAKTGAAMGVGATVAGAAGLWVAIPAAMGVRALFDRYRSAALTSLRVEGRIQRLRDLNAHIRSGMQEQEEEKIFIPGDVVPSDGGVA